MSEILKRCRVCGDPIDHHPLAFRDCIVKAYGLPIDWPATYEAYLLLCLKNGYVERYSQNFKIYDLKFVHMEKPVTVTSPDEVARVLLADLAPTPIKRGVGTVVSKSIDDELVIDEPTTSDVIDLQKPPEKNKRWSKEDKEE